MLLRMERRGERGGGHRVRQIVAIWCVIQQVKHSLRLHAGGMGVKAEGGPDPAE